MISVIYFNLNLCEDTSGWPWFEWDRSIIYIDFDLRDFHSKCVLTTKVDFGGWVADWPNSFLNSVNFVMII